MSKMDISGVGYVDRLGNVYPFVLVEFEKLQSARECFEQLAQYPCATRHLSGKKLTLAVPVAELDSVLDVIDQVGKQVRQTINFPPEFAKSRSSNTIDLTEK